jgi:hypothetical protein
MLIKIGLKRKSRSIPDGMNPERQISKTRSEDETGQDKK